MAMSDIVDGRLARRLKVVSSLGVFLDTISDKIFVAGALIPMVERGLLPSWLAATIILREFAVSGLRSYAASAGVVIAARAWGKQKQIFIVMAIIWRLVYAAAITAGITAPFIFLPMLWPIPMAIALILTIVSGIEYFWNARTLLRSPTSLPPNEE
jgi:CDP-diacylglycerol--glycerol-3-phosphate 3-phosphatidyltransferase